MTQKWTTIGHCTAFDNEQSPYRIISYKRPGNDKCKTIQMRKLTALFVYEKWMKNIYVTYQKTTTTELQAPDLGQAHTYRIWGVKPELDFWWSHLSRSRAMSIYNYGHIYQFIYHFLCTFHSGGGIEFLPLSICIYVCLSLHLKVVFRSLTLVCLNHYQNKQTQFEFWGCHF